MLSIDWKREALQKHVFSTVFRIVGSIVIDFRILLDIVSDLEAIAVLAVVLVFVVAATVLTRSVGRSFRDQSGVKYKMQLEGSFSPLRFPYICYSGLIARSTFSRAKLNGFWGALDLVK